MKAVPRCSKQPDIDAYFTGRLSPSRAREMRAHAESCEACRAYFARRQMLADLDPEALSEKERGGLALGLVPQKRSRTALYATAATAVLGVAAAAAALLVLPHGAGTEQELSARGHGDAPTTLFVYKVQGDSVSVPERSIGVHDELAFAYVNGSAKRRLLVFGVDEHKHVFWYYPSFTDPHTNPTAITIEAGGERHDLREAVGHAFDGKMLTVHGVFTDEALSVTEVERRVETGAPFPGAVETSTTFEVTP